jgi:urocanate hydratase
LADEALFAIRREMDRSPNLKITLPNLVDDNTLEGLF